MMEKENKKKNRNTLKTAKRLLKYVTGTYKVQFAIVCISIVISALVGVLGVQFIKILIDNFITPLMGSGNPDYSSLLNAVIAMGVIYLVGVLSTYLYNRLMINISQGVLHNIRKEMFEHMQTLPIKYFDSHPHGETMSTYTNDVDTLRQCISQSIPQVFSCIISMISVLIAMFATDIYLTLVVLVMVTIMVIVARFFGTRSSKNFIDQQRNISIVNGYIEEMMAGQKVVKVFCHEEEKRDQDFFAGHEDG